jgi:hypothetical protein
VPVTEEARLAGDAWERLSDPKPQLTLEIYSPGGQESVFYMGPHTPRLTPKEIDLLHSIWLELGNDLGPEELHHHDVVHFALDELEREIKDGEMDRQEVFARLRQHLQDIKAQREPHI